MWHITQTNDFNLGKKFRDLGMFTKGDKNFFSFFCSKKRMHGAPPQIFLSKDIYLKNLTGIFEY
jgi:hypothetical protein